MKMQEFLVKQYIEFQLETIQKFKKKIKVAKGNNSGTANVKIIKIEHDP